MNKNIIIKGARTHNLKNINLKIPHNKLVVITGVSGSGKSSLAFDTLYNEGHRRYVESLSTYARQFLSVGEKPDVDKIDGLSPAIAIEQKATSHNPRSTVGTITEIYDYLRLLFARAGTPHCPDHPNEPLVGNSISEMSENIMKQSLDSKWMMLAPVIKNKKGEHKYLINKLISDGFIRARIDGVITNLAEDINLNKNKKHTIEVVIDRFKIKNNIKLRIAESLETSLNLADGIVIIESIDSNISLSFSSNFACKKCGYSFGKLEPKMFSFNNPIGACNKCNGLGFVKTFDPQLIINYDLSIIEGAISGFNGAYYSNLLSSVCNRFDIDINKSFKQLTKEQQDIICYGSKGIEIDIFFDNGKGLIYQKKLPFEGIINNYQRRYQETDSVIVREEFEKKYIKTINCDSCYGSRLEKKMLNVFIDNKNIGDIVEMNISDAYQYFVNFKIKIKQEIIKPIVNEIKERLFFLTEVGLNYLTLGRSANTLSGGESQRIRLASQIGSGLVGVMYVLDEPSIGLHQRDNARLLKTLKRLRDLGNSIIVVEHDTETIQEADFIIDIGPYAGIHGGKVVAHGTFKQIIKSNSLTADYLTGKKIFKQTKLVKPKKDNYLKLYGAKLNNLKNINLIIPLGLFICITGVSGSGKSTLINQTLYPTLNKYLENKNSTIGLDYKIELKNKLDKIIKIDQSPIGRTPRSNPATYTGIFTFIRDLFAAITESKSRGYKAGRFSFNVKGGRCEACQGGGVTKVEMHFMADVYVTCEVCKGKRYNKETLQILYKGKNIYEVLNMTIEESYQFYKAVPFLERKLKTLLDVGLGYLTLGHSALHLSGGEAQRVKLAKELAKASTSQTIYILDEPTTGLHLHDINNLLNILLKLRDKNSTVVVIEHNLDIIKAADWIIDIGPEGGIEGGQIIVEGSPKTIIKNKQSYTAKFLKEHMKNNLKQKSKN